MPPRPRILPPPPRVVPAAAAASGVSAAPSSYTGSASEAGPKKETARISILPEAAPSPATAKMAKTQPLRTAPQPKVPGAPVIVTTTSPAGGGSGGGPLAMLDAVPVPVAATIFVVSGVTLLIQIWNYFTA